MTKVEDIILKDMEIIHTIDALNGYFMPMFKNQANKTRLTSKKQYRVTEVKVNDVRDGLSLMKIMETARHTEILKNCVRNCEPYVCTYVTMYACMYVYVG